MTTTPPPAPEEKPTAEDALQDLVDAVTAAKAAMPPGQAQQQWAQKLDQALQEAKVALEGAHPDQSLPAGQPPKP
ncbi:MAG TPA: hypothetical protein VFS70_04370 [Actinomycetota bacterium]|nr:hypothetical protein [Actinomycetota bacterium]